MSEANGSGVLVVLTVAQTLHLLPPLWPRWL
jgi:hypothetical protein